MPYGPPVGTATGVSAYTFAGNTSISADVKTITAKLNIPQGTGGMSGRTFQAELHQESCSSVFDTSSESIYVNGIVVHHIWVSTLL